MTRGLLLNVALVAVVGGLPATLFAQATPYDSFDTTSLSPFRWSGLQLQSGNGSSLELTRSISGGALRLSHRVAGGRASNTGTHIGANQLIIRQANVRALQFKITLTKAKATACAAAGSSTGWAVARGNMALFESGTGYVWAALEVRRSSAGGPYEVVAYLVDPDGTPFSFASLGTVPLNTPATLRMKWIPSSNKVDVQLDAGSVVPLTYALNDSTPLSYAGLEIVGFAPNCIAAVQTAEASALFDDIVLNP